jgi:hypothetical protein
MYSSQILWFGSGLEYQLEMLAWSRERYAPALGYLRLHPDFIFVSR